MTDDRGALYNHCYQAVKFQPNYNNERRRGNRLNIVKTKVFAVDSDCFARSSPSLFDYCKNRIFDAANCSLRCVIKHRQHRLIGRKPTLEKSTA
jgi:hypothetical protein